MLFLGIKCRVLSFLLKLRLLYTFSHAVSTKPEKFLYPLTKAYPGECQADKPNSIHLHWGDIFGGNKSNTYYG